MAAPACNGGMQASDKTRGDRGLFLFKLPRGGARNISYLLPVYLPAKERQGRKVPTGSKEENGMKIKEIMTPNVEVVSPDMTLNDAARKMKDLDVGVIPVCDGEKIQGLLTDRDITIRATAEGLNPNSTPVGNVMTPEVHWCWEDDDIEAAEKIMRNQQIRRILVMNRDRKLVGIVSLGDIAVDANKDKQTGRTLEEISQPSQPGKKAA